MAAEKGNIYSQKVLGKRYEGGRGVQKSVEEALRYYRLAADQGDKESLDAIKRLS